MLRHSWRLFCVPEYSNSPKVQNKSQWWEFPNVNISASGPDRKSKQYFIDNPDYSLVLSHTQAKSSLLSLWLCHPTHCLYSSKYFAVTDLAENNTSFSSFKLASWPLQLVQGIERENKGRDLLEGESNQEHGGLILATANMKLHHWLLASGQNYPWPVSSFRGYIGWILWSSK